MDLLIVFMIIYLLSAIISFVLAIANAVEFPEDYNNNPEEKLLDQYIAERKTEVV